jgi:hypothetical protein
MYILVDSADLAGLSSLHCKLHRAVMMLFVNGGVGQFPTSPLTETGDYKRQENRENVSDDMALLLISYQWRCGYYCRPHVLPRNLSGGCQSAPQPPSQAGPGKELDRADRQVTELVKPDGVR